MGVRRGAAAEDLTRHYRVQSLEGLGIGATRRAGDRRGGRPAPLSSRAAARRRAAARAAGDRSRGGVMPLDEMTRRNLELVRVAARRGTGGHAALRARSHRDADGRAAACGNGYSRRSPTGQPSTSDWTTVGMLFGDALAREELRTALDGVRDVERLGAKIASGRATPARLRALGDVAGATAGGRRSLGRCSRRTRRHCRAAARRVGRLRR